ncbi:MAG: alpha/beta hydrolase [Syntrophorhabdales bacterium]
MSRDGTSIAFQRSGAGVPLVLVHGTSSTLQTWAPVLPFLERHFTVYAIDRRGRGESGDSAAPYAMEREFEDVAAVVDAIGDSVHLFGHSYGAICALEASLLTARIDRLILYEPPIPESSSHAGDDKVLEKMQNLLAAGDREAVVTTVMREMVRRPPQEIQLSKSMPAWPSRVAAVHTIPREILALRKYSFEPHRFKAAVSPTLLLLGGESPAHFRTAVRLLESVLANSKTAVMAGQQHAATETAPELLAEAVSAFLLSR